MRKVIELTEDMIIPKGTKFYRYSESVFYDPYVGVVGAGMKDAVISVVFTDDALDEIGNKFYERE